MQIALLFTFTLYTKLFQNPMPEAWPTSTPGTQNRSRIGTRATENTKTVCKQNLEGRFCYTHEAYKKRRHLHAASL
jgi:hypothetical protein